jgi:hypothetical protein
VNAFITLRRLRRALVFAWGAVVIILFPYTAGAQKSPPNILVIMGDDIGYWNISAYNRPISTALPMKARF